MKILLLERFQHDLRALSQAERTRCFELVLALPKTIGKPHEHSGIGVRKIHKSGVWEARLGLSLRLVFALREGDAILVTIGSHEDVRRYLASL